MIRALTSTSGMAGRFAIFAVFPALMSWAAAPLLADGKAERRIIGFSPDGKVFAFGHYGVEHGSGVPYAGIVAIDTGKDILLPGMPIWRTLDKSGSTVEDARKAAADRAKAWLTQRHVGEPGEMLFDDAGAVSLGGEHRVQINPKARTSP